MYDLLIQHCNRGGAGYYWVKEPGGAKLSTWFDPANLPDPFAEGDIYFGVNPAKARRERDERARLEDIAAVNCVFAEFDAHGASMDDLYQHIESLPLRPSVLVNSGGGFHAYWLLAEPQPIRAEQDLEHWRWIQAAWVLAVGSDAASKDLARVLRVPGTYNYKYDPPREVIPIWADFDCLYWPEDLVALLPRPEQRQEEERRPGTLPPNLDDWLGKALARGVDGQRNKTGFWLACQLRDDGVSQSEAETVLRSYQAQVRGQGRGAYTLKEALDSLRSAYKSGPRPAARDVTRQVTPEEPEMPPMEGSADPPSPSAAMEARTATNGEADGDIGLNGDALPELRYLAMDQIRSGFDLQEVGDADLFAGLFAGHVVHDHAEKAWYLWRGHYWEEDRTGYVYQLLARRVAPQYLHAAAELTAKGLDQLGKEYAKRAASLRNKKRLDNVLYLAARDPRMALTGEEWDADPWLLGCLNGVIDLHTGKERPGKPADYIRAHIDADWRGLDEPAPRWERFLSEVFAGDMTLVFFMQRLLGYGLTGLSTEHVFPILWGEGRNGKGTMLQVLYETLGERIATPVPAEELMSNPRGSQGAQPFLYGLRGKRLVWASESERGHRIDESLVKRLTGGDTITVRTLYAKPVSFDPTHLILMLTNYRPHINANGQAIWDRVLLIPFTERFVVNPAGAHEHPQDPFLGERLQQERAGILAWLVRGCLEWREVRLMPPDSVLLATQAYRDEEDLIGMYMGERCEVDPGLWVKASELYASYQNWCKESGFTAMSLSSFGAEMGKRFERKRTKKGWYYYGLSLRLEQPA